MAIFARCTECDTRRDHCTAVSSHRRFVRWTVDVKFSRAAPRKQKSFETKERAEKQERLWKDEWEEGTLGRKKDQQPKTFREALERYKRDHVMVYNHIPQKSTVYLLNTLDEALGRYQLTDLTDDELGKGQTTYLTTEIIADTRAKLVADREWTGSTANRQFGIASAILERARRWNWIKNNPMEFLDSLPENDTVPRFLDEDEIHKLWRHIKDPILDNYAFTILRTGARPCSIEACDFDNGDVDLRSRIIWFTTFKGYKSKKHRYAVPIDDELYPRILKRYEETGGKGKVFVTTNVHKLARKAIEASGINEGKAADRKFTIYGLKHCYASHLIMNGAPESAVAELLGHTDTKMIHKHYAHLTLEYLRKTQATWKMAPQMEPHAVRLEVIG